MRYFHFNLPVSVKPCASSRISWIPRTSMLLIRSLISAKTKKSYFIDILTLRESIISLADAFPLFRYVPSPSEMRYASTDCKNSPAFTSFLPNSSHTSCKIPE